MHKINGYIHWHRSNRMVLRVTDMDGWIWISFRFIQTTSVLSVFFSYKNLIENLKQSENVQHWSCNWKIVHKKNNGRFSDKNDATNGWFNPLFHLILFTISFVHFTPSTLSWSKKYTCIIYTQKHTHTSIDHPHLSTRPFHFSKWCLLISFDFHIFVRIDCLQFRSSILHFNIICARGRTTITHEKPIRKYWTNAANKL